MRERLLGCLDPGAEEAADPAGLGLRPGHAPGTGLPLDPVQGRQISISAGIARFPEDGTSADELLGAAQSALERARSRGRGTLASATVGAG